MVAVCMDCMERGTRPGRLSCSERVGHWLTLPPSGGLHAIREQTGLAPLKKEKARQVVRRDQGVYLTEPKFRNHKGSKLSSLWLWITFSDQGAPALAGGVSLKTVP